MNAYTMSESLTESDQGRENCGVEAMAPETCATEQTLPSNVAAICVPDERGFATFDGGAV
jgi:hypothetical protein